MSKGKEHMAWLCTYDPDAYVKIVKERDSMEPKNSAFPVSHFLGGDKPECTEPDCYGIILLGRHPESFKLDPFARCTICGRRYTVEGIKEVNEELRNDVGLNIDNCSNDIPECLHCGVAITPENDSGWEGFVPPEGIKSQPICITCEKNRDKGPVLKEGSKPEDLN